MDTILVTDWERVDKDDFYLSEEWRESSEEGTKKEFATLRRKAANEELYVGYIVSAASYCVYWEMDADQVFIDADMNVLLRCESEVIGNKHEACIEYSG